MYKPAGYNSLSPYLIVENAEQQLGFIGTVFGPEPLFVHRGDDGGIVHAEVRIDDTVLMIGQSSGGTAANIHLYVADVDAAFARALDAGATVVQAVAEKGDGDRRGGVADPCGTVWWLSTQLQPRPA